MVEEVHLGHDSYRRKWDRYLHRHVFDALPRRRMKLLYFLLGLLASVLLLDRFLLFMLEPGYAYRNRVRCAGGEKP